MTIVEAGILAGIPTGAVIGALSVTSPESPSIGILVAFGLLIGGAVGWVYSYVMIACLSVAGVLWRSALRRHEQVPAQDAVASMTWTANAGAMLGVLALGFVGGQYGWLYGVLVGLIVAVITSALAVALADHH